MNDAVKPFSERARVRRVAERGHYDRATLDAIIDAAYLCHVAFADERGTHCIPTACWRSGDYVYIHGSNGSLLLKAAAAGAQICLTISHLDGLVLARSAFHHTMNYRSAIVYGLCERVEGDAKAHAMDVFMEKIAPGRIAEVRNGNAKELAATTVLRLRLEEFACKIREGGPKDDEEDLKLDVWAGVLPLAQMPLAPTRDGSASAMPAVTPDYVTGWHRP